MEDAEVDLRRGTERDVSGRAGNLRYGAMKCNHYERLLTLITRLLPTISPPTQSPLSMTIALGVSSDMLISITSEPSECADLLKRACPPGL